MSSPALDLDTVKRIAKEEKCILISFSQRSRVISFRKEYEGVSVRINVYWTTGTVGTCMDHPQKGKTQLFRRNVSVATLREIFRNPRVHTGDGYYRRESKSSGISLPNFSTKLRIGDRVYVRGYTDATIASLVQEHGVYRGKILVRYDDGQTYNVNPDALQEPSTMIDDDECVDLESEVKLQMSCLDDELQRIQAEKSKLQEILLGFEQEREKERKQEEARQLAAKRKAEEDAAAERAKKIRLEKERKLLRLQQERSQRGFKFMYALDDDANDFISKSFDKTLTCMACNGSSVIMLYEDGGWAFSSGLPLKLYNKLNGRRHSLPSPVYVSLGSQDRYYIEFADGRSEWVGCDGMTKQLQTSKTRKVKSVAFGEYWDSYFIVHTDGFWGYSNVPLALSNLMDKRKCKSDLDCVSLGPEGEYFISAKNGRAWWGGMRSDAMTQIGKQANNITFVDFGDNGTWLARYK